MKNLTKRQAEILAFIRSYHELHGYSPSFRELAAHFELASLGTVSKHVEGLIRKGYLKKQKSASRAIEPLYREERSNQALLNIPIIGTISRGSKLELFAKINTIQLPTSFMKSDLQHYGFLAKDNSFIQHAIMERDLVVVEARERSLETELLLTSSKNSGVDLKHTAERSDEHIHGAVIVVIRDYLGFP